MSKRKIGESVGNQTDVEITSHTKKAYLSIKEMFSNNEIGPGQKIPYWELAKRLGMSLTPIVQALNQLELQGLVKHVPKRGYYSESMNLSEVKEIYELRELIEISLLSKTMKLLNEQGVKKLKASLESESQAEHEIDLSDRLRKSIKFHLTLASLSECPTHQHILEQLFDLMLLKYKSALLTVVWKHYVNSHKNIFDAIVSRDLRKAQKLLLIHISETREYFVKALSGKMEDKGRGNNI
jgi:DNA-binding GntR family transcriptional regulator